MVWPTKKLGEIISFQKGKKMAIDSTGEPYIGIDGLRTNQYSVYTQDKKGVRCKPADVLLVWDGAHAGTVGTGLNGFVGSTIVKVLHEDCLESKFLFYLLKFFQEKIRAAAQGAAIPHLSKVFVNNIKITLPPLKNQKDIIAKLDGINNGQKLNDELIQKTQELFKSLLRNELEPVGKNWEEDKFVNCIEKNPIKIKGIPREKYQSIGKFPVIDQSDKFIAGYTDNEDRIYKINSPVIIFGDHTRIFKYIDFNFAIGADGTQIIIPDKKKFIPHFFYFSMLNLKIINLGYSRHFKLLKTKKVNIPPIKIQRQIVVKMSAVQDYKRQLFEQKTKLKELFDSVLAKSMKGE